MNKDVLESYLSGNLYFMSLYRCVYQAKKLFPDVYQLLDANNRLMGDDSRLSQLLLEDKKEINGKLNSLLQVAHFDYFRYVKNRQGDIRVILEIEDFVSDVTPSMDAALLEEMYSIQKSGNKHDFFKVISPNDSNTMAANYPDYDYSFDSWWDKEDGLDETMEFLESALRKKDAFNGMTMDDYISSYSGLAKQKKFTLQS